MKSYDSNPFEDTIQKLSRLGGSIQIKSVKDKEDPEKRIPLVFIRVKVLGHRKSLVEDNVRKFQDVNLSEGRINLEVDNDGRMELVGIIRPKNLDRLWFVSLGLLKKMSYCIFSYKGNSNDRSNQGTSYY